MADHAHETDHAVHSPARRGISGEIIFLWIAWGLTAAWFFPFALRSAIGILSATPNAGAPAADAPDPGGAGFVLIDIVGVAVLGLALAYGLYRYATRNRALDPLSEAATKRQYDAPHERDQPRPGEPVTT